MTGESHYFNGRRYRLDVIEHHGLPAVCLRNNTTMELRVRSDTDREAREAVVHRWYRRWLRNQLAPLLARWEPRVGVMVEDARMNIGFIGLGNVGGKLAGSLLRNGLDLTVRDLDRGAAQRFLDAGAHWGESPARMMESCDAVITCLPTPAASAEVLEAEDGLLSGMGPGKIWMEMSTTDEAEVRRLGEKVAALGGEPVDCPVSGGCHRADTGNISIFAGCERPTFERVLPLLTTMGRRILHTGPLGSASTLKVITNYLATANLVSCCEALVTAKAAGMDLNTAWEAMRISSGNSFVHETES